MFLIEIARAFSFFCDKAPLEPFVVFAAEVHQLGFLRAALSRTARRYGHDVFAGIQLLMLEFSCHEFDSCSGHQGLDDKSLIDMSRALLKGFQIVCFVATWKWPLIRYSETSSFDTLETACVAVVFFSVSRRDAAFQGGTTGRCGLRRTWKPPWIVASHMNKLTSHPGFNDDLGMEIRHQE